jgi:hypothetical protein
MFKCKLKVKMSKTRYHLRNLSGITFKTADNHEMISRRYSDDFSNKMQGKIFMTSGELTTKTEMSALSLLKSRKNVKEEEKKITPKTISNVVKNYILPMFTSDLKSKRKNKRTQEYGLKSNAFDASEGTVYAELKLSDNLRKENAKILSKLRENDENLQLFKFKKTEAEKELISIKDDLNASQALVLGLSLSNQYLERSSDLAIKSLSSHQSKYKKYKELFKDSVKNIEQLTQTLDEEKALNDIR